MLAYDLIMINKDANAPINPPIYEITFDILTAFLQYFKDFEDLVNIKDPNLKSFVFLVACVIDDLFYTINPFYELMSSYGRILLSEFI